MHLLLNLHGAACPTELQTLDLPLPNQQSIRVASVRNVFPDKTTATFPYEYRMPCAQTAARLPFTHN